MASFLDFLFGQVGQPTQGGADGGAQYPQVPVTGLPPDMTMSQWDAAPPQSRLPPGYPRPADADAADALPLSQLPGDRDHPIFGQIDPNAIYNAVYEGWRSPYTVPAPRLGVPMWNLPADFPLDTSQIIDQRGMGPNAFRPTMYEPASSWLQTLQALQSFFQNGPR